MKLDHLQALTICIFYSDYLRSALRNKIHFDTWTVITCPDDKATIQLCEENGIQIIVTDLLGPSGEAFDSAYSKGRMLNFALDQLPGQGWTLLIDADTILPANFRTRLNSQDLSRRSIYGLAGRRDAPTWRDYETLLAMEPWADFAGTHPHLMGYFQLFRLDQPNNRYPHEKETMVMHDDIAFQLLFKPALRRRLPMWCLQVGPPVVNWGGRVSANFTGNSGAQFALPIGLQALAKSTSTLALLGLTEITKIDEINRLVTDVSWLDWHGMANEQPCASAAADMTCRRALLPELSYAAVFPRARESRH